LRPLQMGDNESKFGADETEERRERGIWAGKDLGKKGDAGRQKKDRESPQGVI